MARSRTPIGNEDVNMTRCTRCGFPCDLSRDTIGSGNGKVYTAIPASQRTSLVTLGGQKVTLGGEQVTLGGQAAYAAAPSNFTVNYGCPQCGRGDYTDSRFFK